MTNNSPNTGTTAKTAKAHPTTNRATEVAHEAIDRAAASAGPAEDRLRETATEARARLRQSGERLQERSGDLAQQTQRYVDEHPLASLGIAFAAGLVVASLLRR
ncbi:MAG TPA: hypothetical protein VM616_04920 [Gammaproteobacteria bacterium]|nr:hypothetical protein [Gammaproteobacteria bacterium]